MGVAPPGPAGAAQQQRVAELPNDLTQLSLESLMNIEVTTVSKKEEKLFDAAAATYVLTGDEIRRSGARNLAEALRLIPGINVARIDAHNWAITARGFNSSLADKMEVVMDGRSLYTPLFSGVFWEVQQTFLEDIDRIEVVRGPGGSLWGANAVNGVINIITKDAKNTQGAVALAGAGNEKTHFEGGRYGGRLGDNGYYRAYARGFEIDDSKLTSGGPANDSWNMGQGGFRTDWDIAGRDHITVQGDVYDGSLDQAQNKDEKVSGLDFIGRWSRVLSAQSDIQVQAYYDRTERDIPGSFAADRDTYDLSVRHHVTLGRNDIVWGAGYRRSQDDIRNSTVVMFTPRQRALDIYNLFFQDQIALRDDLTLTLGSKVEHNEFTGYEIQPTARIAWLFSERQTFWAAISRAVRTPNRLDNDVRLAVGPPFGFIVGSEDFESETVIAYELGHRIRLRDNLSLDTALFYNDYNDLRGIDLTSTPSPEVSNEGKGEGAGAEFLVTWQPRNDWRLQTSYSYLNLDLRAKPGSSDPTIAGTEGNDPKHQGFIRSSWDISEHWSLDGMLRYVDDLPNQGVSDYTELNLRLAWYPRDDLEFALTGQNLLHASHREFGTLPGNEIERSIFASVTFRP